ncbi:MAG: serine/threonine-protein kinase [Vicinamibacterales bacterium]
MSRVIAPRRRTVSTSAGTRHSSGRLPATLLGDQVRRLAICALVGAGLWSFGLVMDSTLRPLALGTLRSTRPLILEAVSIAVSAAMWLYVRFAPHQPQTKVNVALLYYVLNAGGVACLNSWTPAPLAAMSSLLSWNAVVILVAGMIIPASPGRIFAASLIAASTDPLARWLTAPAAATAVPAVRMLVMYLPNYACAAVAMLPSQVLQRLGQTLKQAQDMGSYHLEELLGKGGMGEVWRASHRLFARTAAVKLIRPELMGVSTVQDSDALIRRFHREAEATAVLESPHTIRLFDFGVTEDRTFYYVMELLTGCDLESLVRRAGPVPAERVIFLLRQVCHSLAEAHAQGLVHRDITPRNIYVCRMGLDYDFVKVLDFGLVARSKAVHQTIAGHDRSTTGTPAFMAPEVILEEAVDARADIYALGCVAYYLLTGELVFDGDTPMKMFMQHVQAEPIPPSLRSELPIPTALETLVLACLAKAPGARPQSIAELAQQLDAIVLKDRWSNDAARRWWSTHLVDLAVPEPYRPAAPPSDVLSPAR